MKIRRSKPYIIIIITMMIYAWLYQTHYLDIVDHKVYDFFTKRYDFRKDEKNNIVPSVVIVEIDKKSIDVLGQWPWPRIITANLIEKIHRVHPAVIGINIMFRHSDKSSPVTIAKFYKNYLNYNLKISGLDKKFFDNDKILAQALKNSKSVLPVLLENGDRLLKKCTLKSTLTGAVKDTSTLYNASSVLCNMQKFQNAASAEGFINTTIDSDDIVRKTPLFIKYKDTIVPSFALASLLCIDKKINFPSKNSVSLLGHNFKTNDLSEVSLYFYKPTRYKHVSAIDILDGSVPMQMFTGKIVLIGTSVIGATNEHMVASGYMLSGTDISATVIENIVNDHIIWQPNFMKSLNLLIAFVISLIATFLLYRNKNYLFAFFYISVLIISFTIAVVAFQYGIYLRPAYLWVPILIHLGLLSLVLFYVYNKEKKIYYEELSNSHAAALESMVLVAGIKDFETGAHLKRTKEYIKILARYLQKHDMNKEDISDYFLENIYHSAPLHDIGKVGIPDAVLQKPGKLTDQEFAIMKEHPKLGMEIISDAMKSYPKNNFLKTAYNITYYHHEKWDGSGYPLGLKGEEIPLEARLMALVDVYDALISRRCYKDAFTFEDAERIIISQSGKHFDPIIVDAFIMVKDGFRDIARRHQ